MPKPEHAIPTLEINWRSYFDLLQLVPSVGTAFPRVFGMNGGYFRASKLRQARSSSLEPPHALMRHWSSLMGCPRATAIFALQNTIFRAPKQQNGTTFGVLSGRPIIWWWTRHHQRGHAPPCADLTSEIHYPCANHRRIFSSPDRRLSELRFKKVAPPSD
uniref:Uncharacterized protein n=1 Tax=Fagus sylvatica TaxID=28930 RepID=A0A2N9EZ60_FAGSY